MEIPIIILTLASTAWSASPLCYWPNGDVAIGQFPCGTGGHSTCCATGYACLNNHMCLAVTDEALIKGPLYARGACTDSFWESSNCPSFCRATGYDVLNGQQVMHRCDNNDLLFYCESRSKPDCEHTQRVIVYSSQSASRGVAASICLRHVTDWRSDSDAHSSNDHHGDRAEPRGDWPGDVNWDPGKRNANDVESRGR